MKISCLPSVKLTDRSSSFSSIPIAMMPPARGLPYADSGVFLMIPFFVQKMT